MTGGQVTQTFSLGAHCESLASAFNDLLNGVDMYLVRTLLFLVPLFAGVSMGATLATRDFEDGTAAFYWTLTGSPRRWLVGTALPGLLLLVPLLLAVGVSADILESASNPGINVYASFVDFPSRGVIDVFWGLAAFSLTLLIGTRIGRTMPALMTGIVACFFLRGLWGPAMEATVLRPLAVEQATASSPSSLSPGPLSAVQNDLVLYSNWYLNGEPFAGDPAEWIQAHTVLNPDGSVSQPDASRSPQQENFAIPGHDYWVAVAIESAGLALVFFLSGGVALWGIQHRRPY